MEIIQDSNKPVDDNSINTNTFRMEDNMEQQPKNPEPARNDEPIDNNKAQEKSSNNTEKKKCCCKCNTVLSCACFRNQSCLTHFLCKQCLT